MMTPKLGSSTNRLSFIGRGRSRSGSVDALGLKGISHPDGDAGGDADASAGGSSGDEQPPVPAIRVSEAADSSVSRNDGAN